MAEYKLTESAKSDLTQLYETGVISFGLAQADKYLLELEQRFLLLAKNSNLGRSADDIFLGLRRFPYSAHTVFYSRHNNGILVVRVLRQEMDFVQHLK